MKPKETNARVSAAKDETELREETFYKGPSGIHLASFPPKERWDEWTELDSKSWPKRSERRYALVPTTCFNCESACGLLAYVDLDSGKIRKLEGNPEHPGSRGRNCAKGPATLNQINDPDRILYPLKRVGRRGDGQWERVGWEGALTDIAGRIKRAIQENRRDEIMYHVGRPGEDGFTERILAAWGVDGHNSHTNVCSSNARAGYQFWMGHDRPSPDYANAKVILMISAHLETGHYFNPHAQRIIEAKTNGAKIIVLDTRLSNTATHADYWLPSYPGSEAAVLLSIANYLIQNRLYNRAFVERWWNWQEYLEATLPNDDATFESFHNALCDLYVDYTFDFAAAESGIEAAVIEEVAKIVAGAGTQLATHTWRSASAGNEGGWQVARTIFFLNALMGAVATKGGTCPNGWNKYVPKPMYVPPHPGHWNELTWPVEYPLAMNELSFLLPHFLNEGRGKVDVYFTRVYNPVWTNPDGFSWIEMLKDESKIGLHVALTPTWNETAYFADYVLPMGHSCERHDLHSFETHDGQWIGFRQPVLRALAERKGETVSDTRDVNPGEVWEENEFWLDLTWRIDEDGSLGIRQFVESKKSPGEKLSVDEYYGYIFENSVPGLPEKADAEGLTPLQYMRRYGTFEIKKTVGPVYEQEVPAEELEDTGEDHLGRVYTRTPTPASSNIAPSSAPDPDARGRRAVGVKIAGKILSGFPTPSGKLEFYSRTLASWGWPEYAIPTYMKSHVHPDNMGDGQKVLISTFRLPVHIHTRSANSKWLDEIAHSNPLWLHPKDAAPLQIKTGDLVRIATEIGYYVVKAWVTEGIKPGIVACSHHMGRWKLHETNQSQMTATAKLERDGPRWSLRREGDGERRGGVSAYSSSDPDTGRIWWTDAGVHQNLTFPVHPDPISGQHCWHQAVTVSRAVEGDSYGDVYVDTDKSRAAYLEWLRKTRPASSHSPDATRRPSWLMRPLKPGKEHFQLPKSGS